MKLRITSGGLSHRTGSGPEMRVLHQEADLILEGSRDVRSVLLRDGRRLFVAGHVVGRLTTPRGISPLSADLEELVSISPGPSPGTLEGRYILALVHNNGACVVWTDRFGQLDVYYQQVEDSAVLASDMALLPVARGTVDYDQVALAHTLTVYGCRPAKRHTLYRGVHRLGVDEYASIAHGRLTVETLPFQPIQTRNCQEPELEEYADLLLEAVRARASSDGNVVYLSSGWDSTAILACLVQLFGARRVRAVIGRMIYAERTGVVNQFEIDRAQAVAEFFGVPLDVVEFDYWRRGREVIEQVRQLFRSNQVASITGLNHQILAEHVARTSRGSEVVFAGEISDGAHNLGFSQFVTIFHPVLAFREYSDKMASYVYGPTFLGLFQQGQFESDVVYDLLRRRRGNVQFDELAEPSSRTMQLLASFFLRSNRFPLWSLRNAGFLTERGREAYSAEMESMYLGRAAKEASPETLYSWYLQLYNSFHWQSSTVATLALTADALGLPTALPFWDSRLQEFLCAMPESWGRGLDFNPTKYPLKWALRHRIKYPLHLQIGPHSYLYDVRPGFSHSAEILYGSAFAPYFREILGEKKYERLLSAEIFDLGYIDSIVRRYREGIESRGAEMSDLLSLCCLSMIGWYGD
jgi:hypothetical protein